MRSDPGTASAAAAAAVPRFHPVQADLSQRREIQRLVTETVATMGRLDVVASNGG
jgi:NAD(P)-dependent dehydrogenase (short-subunit alcohol dehydrogenase family)